MKTGSILLGLVLIALAALWFFTPYSAIILDYFGVSSQPATGTRGVGVSPPVSWEAINMALNAANAVFGALGVYLTIRGARAKPE